MRIAICDDEDFIYEQLRDYIRYAMVENKIRDQVEIVYFSSGEKLIQSYKNHKRFDILFLDIAMRRLDGITVGKAIREFDENAIFIFVSSHQERALETFDCVTFHFLPKPLKYPKFNQVFVKAVKPFHRDHAQYVIQFRNEIIRIPIDQIKYVEVVRRHLMFHTMEGDFEMVSTLRETLEELRPYDFIQVHQGFLVNMNQIKRLLKSELILVDGATIPLSVHRRPEVVMSYKNFLERY